MNASAPETVVLQPVKGDYVKFIGYSLGTSDPILQPGDIVLVQVAAPDANTAMTVVKVGTDVADSLFPEEISEATAEEIEAARAVTEAAAPATEAPAAKGGKAKNGKGKGKGKATAEAAPAPAEPTSEEAPAETVDPVADPLNDDVTEEEIVADAPAPAPAPIKAKAKKTTKAKDGTATPASADTAVATTGHADEDDDLVFTIGKDLAAVREMLESTAAHDAAKSLVERSEELSFTLGGVLAHIYKEGIHKQMGYTGKRAFADYALKELNVDYRKARYLIRIYAKVTSLGLDEEHLAGIGWSKVKELTKIDDREDFIEHLDYARSHSRTELVEKVREYFEEAGEEQHVTVKKVKMTFAFTSEAADNVKAALAAAAPMAGSSDLSVCAEHIIGEWRSMQEGVEVPLEEAIALLEARYRVRLQIATPENATEEASAIVSN